MTMKNGRWLALSLLVMLTLLVSGSAQTVPQVLLKWDPPAVAGAVVTGYQLARCTLPATATTCTCMPTLLQGAITTATTYTDTPALGLYCYSVVTLATVDGQPAQSELHVPYLMVFVGTPPRTAPASVSARRHGATGRPSGHSGLAGDAG